MMGDGACTRCGDCCDPIHLSWPKSKAAGKDDSNHAILKLWKRVSREEANRRRRNRKGAGPTDWTQRTYYYRCTAFDEVTRTCTIQDRKPPICAGFPYYGGMGGVNYEFSNLPTPDLFGEDLNVCGYWLDVPAARVPAYVDITSIRVAVRDQRS